MAWEGSDRRERLPDDWPERVAAVKERDQHRCTWRLPRSKRRCPRRGTDVDHRNPDGGDGLENLQLLCGFHHGKKSAWEGVQGRRKRKGPRRAPEPLPGRLR